MIVTCPECTARYRLADDAVPPEGRAMRCAACKHRWYAMAPLDEAPPPTPTPEQAARAPDPEPDAAPDDRHATRKTVAAMVVAAALTTGAALLWVPDLPPLNLSRVPWLERIVMPAAMPKSPLGIVFTAEREIVEAGGPTVFWVRGEVINPTRQPQPIPPLEGRIVDPGGTIVYRWQIEPRRTALPPGGRAAFEGSAVGNPGDRAVVRFKD